MQNKILRIGDPHVQVSNIKDSEKLIDFCISTALERNVGVIEMLGDLFHTHAVVRLEVIDFWQKSIEKILNEGFDCRILVGNHDQIGSKEKEQEINALNIFKDVDQVYNDKYLGSLLLVNKPLVSYDNIGYIPYTRSEEDFFRAASDLYKEGAKGLLVAHQTFTGAQYENGFFSEEGIDPGGAPQQQIISGHIHKSQQVGKCFYPGTPKWDTMADANDDKGIWIFTHMEDGKYVDKEFISTKNIVTPIVSYHVKEGDEIPVLDRNARNYVKLEGKTAWINSVKKKIKDVANIKILPTDRSVKSVNEQNTTLEDYIKLFEPVDGVSREEIKEFLRSL